VPRLTANAGLSALAATALCLLLPALARAQGDSREAKATFATYVSGREVARESYTFAPRPDGIHATSSTTSPPSSKATEGPPRGARFLRDAAGPTVI
jgi:hypothetical protein